MLHASNALNIRQRSPFVGQNVDVNVASDALCLIYFNSAILSQLLISFEYQQDEEKLQIVKQASPVAWYNINLKGTYNFELSEKLPDLDDLMSKIEGYKPLQKK